MYVCMNVCMYTYTFTHTCTYRLDAQGAFTGPVAGVKYVRTFVAGFQAGGPAGRAPLEIGDEVLSVDGISILQMEWPSVAALIQGVGGGQNDKDAGAGAGALVTLTVSRNGGPGVDVSLTRQSEFEQIRRATLAPLPHADAQAAEGRAEERVGRGWAEAVVAVSRAAAPGHVFGERPGKKRSMAKWQRDGSWCVCVCVRVYV